MTQRDHVSLLGVFATVVGLALHPLASVPVLVLAAALAFAGAARFGCVVVVVLTLAAVAGLRVDAAERPADSPAGRAR